MTKLILNILKWLREPVRAKAEQKPSWPYCPICHGKMHEARAELPDDPGYHRPYGVPKRVVRVWKCTCSEVPLYPGTTCASATFDPTAHSGVGGIRRWG